MPLVRRIIEDTIRAQLRRNGGVLITGPKAVGKTTTARAIAASEVRLDRDHAARTAAAVDPSLILAGDEPRLIDEYQLVEGVYEAVRGHIDDEGRKGMFLLTGSAQPPDHVRLHSGARRLAHTSMRTLSLLELGHSSGAVSLNGLIDGDAAPSLADRIPPRQVADWLCIGGWPDNIGLGARGNSRPEAPRDGSGV